MTKPIIYLLLALIGSSCQNKASFKDEKKSNFFDSLEDKKINQLKTLGLSKYNDSAKWRLYTIFCDDSCSSGSVNFVKKEFPKIPLSFLDLKLSLVDKTNDSLALLYFIVYHDSVLVSNYLDNKHISEGVIFDIKNDTLIGYVSGEGTLRVSGANNRYVNPIQPQVVNFLTKNQEKLNPWLNQEAKRRKIIH